VIGSDDHGKDAGEGDEQPAAKYAKIAAESLNLQNSL
jgi:hypothetical protein